VFEGFVEASLPLLSGRFLAEELTLDAAYRTADYTHSGSADAWKVGAIWAPFGQLSLRATYSEAVRAPNIEEAFLQSRPDEIDIERGEIGDPIRQLAWRCAPAHRAAGVGWAAAAVGGPPAPSSTAARSAIFTGLHR